MREPLTHYTLGGMHLKRPSRRSRAGILAAVAALVLTACGGTETIHRVDADAFAKAIKQPGVTVIDVRTPAEFAAGHIAGAVNLDVEGGSFANDILDYDKSKTYAVYCASGARSYSAATQMADAGFKDIYDLDGGVTMWQATGHALVTN